MKIDDFFKQKGIEYLKVYLVLYFKKFSWIKELENEFNISSKIVKKAIEILEENQMIISKDFWSLDIETQKIIKNINAPYFKKINSYPKIYTLIEQDINYLELFKDEFEKLLKNESLKATLSFTQEKTKAFEILKNNSKEDGLDFRKDFDEKGTLYYYRTDDYKKKKENILKEITKLDFKDKLDFKKNEITKTTNSKKVETESFENKLKIFEEQDKKIEKEKANIGNSNIKKNYNSKNKRIIDIFLEEENNREVFSSIDFENENIQAFEDLILEIKKNKKLSYFRVEERLKTKNNIQNFIEYIQNSNEIFIDDDYDYFIYKI